MGRGRGEEGMGRGRGKEGMGSFCLFVMDMYIVYDTECVSGDQKHDL